MSVLFSTFYLEVQRQLGDYSSVTLDLIKMFTNERLKDFCAEWNWRDLNCTYDFGLTAGTRLYTMTSQLSNTGTTDDIIGLKASWSNQPLSGMVLKRYNELIQDYTTYKGQPTHFVPYTDKEFYLFPTPQQTGYLTVYLQRQHTTLTSASQYFQLSDDKVNVIKYGVLADLYVDKDDTRAANFERKYQRGLQQKKANQRKYINEQDARLEPGNGLE